MVNLRPIFQLFLNNLGARIGKTVKNLVKLILILKKNKNKNSRFLRGIPIWKKK